MIVRVTVSTGAISTVLISKGVVLSGFLGFLLIGAVQAFYGATQFGLRDTYSVDSGQRRGLLEPAVHQIVAAASLGGVAAPFAIAALAAAMRR